MHGHRDNAMRCDSCGVLRCAALCGCLRTEIELVVDAREHLGDGGRVGDHADGALHLGQITAGDDSGRLVVDAALNKRERTIGIQKTTEGTSE